MDLELTSRNRITKQEKSVLLRDIPDETTQGELRRYFTLYAGPEEELIGFAKVTFESGNEAK
jgi:hypothetical protein